MKQIIQKSWGISQLITSSENTALFFNRVYPSQSSSIHYHRNQYNKFIVQQGTIYICLYGTGIKPSTEPSKTIQLTEHAEYIVEPNIWHKFEAPSSYVNPMSPNTFFEEVWVELDHSDIIRYEP